MKHIKLFEDFKDSTAAQANDILKKIDKNLRYNLEYGALNAKGYAYDQSDIYDDNGPYDWMKVEIHKESEKDTYCWTIIYMMDEEFLNDEAKSEDRKVYIEFNKFKLPEYKKIASFKESFPIEDIFKDEFILEQIKKAENDVLKVPKDKKDYEKNLQNQLDSVKKKEEEQPEGEETTTEPAA